MILDYCNSSLVPSLEKQTKHQHNEWSISGSCWRILIGTDNDDLSMIPKRYCLLIFCISVLVASRHRSVTFVMHLRPAAAHRKYQQSSSCAWFWACHSLNDWFLKAAVSFGFRCFLKKILDEPHNHWTRIFAVILGSSRPICMTLPVCLLFEMNPEY